MKKFIKTIQGARGKIIEDACEKRENLLKTFQVLKKALFNNSFLRHYTCITVCYSGFD
jgi:hypothetical protein